MKKQVLTSKFEISSNNCLKTLFAEKQSSPLSNERPIASREKPTVPAGKSHRHCYQRTHQKCQHHKPRHATPKWFWWASHSVLWHVLRLRRSEFKGGQCSRTPLALRLDSVPQVATLRKRRCIEASVDSTDSLAAADGRPFVSFSCLHERGSFLQGQVFGVLPTQSTA